MKIELSCILFFIFSACQPGKIPGSGAASADSDTLLWSRAGKVFRPLTYDESAIRAMDRQPLVDLGHYLFYDPRLSVSGTVSCNSCHDLGKFGMNNSVVATGEGALQGSRNIPSVFNAALHNIYFWDARSSALEDQPGKMVLRQDERSVPHLGVIVDRLRSDTLYIRLFGLAFPDEGHPVNYANVGRAIGAFERTLLTPSRFDMYMDGDLMALDVEEKQGLALFMDAGCDVCHRGVAVGGGFLQKFGIYTDYRTLASGRVDDRGRMELTGDTSDKDRFKVPGLRNAQMTYPYFHNGSVSSLDSSVRIMARTELNMELTRSQTDEIVAFLKTLTGDIRLEAKRDPFGVR